RASESLHGSVSSDHAPVTGRRSRSSRQRFGRTEAACNHSTRSQAMRRNPVLWASFRSLRLVPVLLGLSLFLAVSPADASGQRLVNGLDVSAPAAPRTTGQVESVRQEDGSVRLLVRLSIDIPVQVLARN